MKKQLLINMLSNRNRFRNIHEKIESAIVEYICKTPYSLLSTNQYNTLFTSDYEPGTFYISERSDQNADFLFDEPIQSFKNWFQNVLIGELHQLKTVDSFSDQLNKYGESSLLEDAYHILFFETYSGKMFYETIPNQEYSDTFRRIVLFLIYNDPNCEINSYEKFNSMGRILIPPVLERGKYTLKERLIQSIYSGLIGMDIKDELAATSPLSREKIIALAGKESDAQKINTIFERLDVVSKSGLIDISSWDYFEQEIVNCKSKVSLCWFTDDFIPTLFEMKFMEELLSYNSNIFITIIPRIQSYSNDASWKDVEDFMTLHVFSTLRQHKENGRFSICHHGLAGGAFNGKKLSAKCAKIMIECDHVIISGARSYEMGQGIKKSTYFTGIAICRTYSETVTGVCKDDGGIVFLKQKPGTKSFEGFRDRRTKRHYCSLHNRWFPVARKTALDYLCSNQW